MKRMKKMIILLCALVLLLGGYWMMNRQQETASVREEEGSFPLMTKTAENLSGLEWTKDDVTFHFTKTDGVWQNANQAEYPVAQNAVETIADKLLALEANRRLDNVTDPSIYGLSEPVFTVTAHWTDGTSTAYQMGDSTPFGDGYYLALSDAANVAYTTSTALDSMFDKTMDDFAAMETIPKVENVTRITIGTALDASYEETSRTINSKQHWYAADGRALDGVDDLIADAKAIDWAALVEAVATQEQLAEWKLDEANAIAVTLYNGETAGMTVLLGTVAEDGSYYARLPGSSMVYSVKAGSVNGLLAATADSLWTTALVETNYTDVQTATLTVGEIVHQIQPVQAAEGEETEAAEDEAYNESDSDEDLWKLLTGITASGTMTDGEAGEVLLQVDVTTTDGISASFTFNEYDAESYAVTDGERTLLTAADKVDQLIRTIRTMK